METDFTKAFVAPVIAEEKVRGNRRERVNLEPTASVAHLIGNLIRLFK